ncbi:DUF4279 domain-containing protein [Chryseobacterium rhizosphaerae]|uniref:DUF4279 domain-containing protein n=1 Tax=Chryseobacterium rhizosphaerae TaxID=395937 RepID=UPI0023586773|nr:DUF4279 domain-containing protein [Chryseobacterium rhizosphaerae]MDC8100596.1 DUF4279 domain-containing protein [Chryseobacterium rhizosphaerae]
MNYNTNIKITFSIFGCSFDPNDFTLLLGIVPTNTWMEGELIPNNKKNKKREESAWEYSVHSSTVYFEEVSDKLVAVFKEKMSLVDNYINEINNLTIKFDIVLEIIEEQGIVLYFNKSFLNMVNELNAEIEVDTYILKSE